MLAFLFFIACSTLVRGQDAGGDPCSQATARIEELINDGKGFREQLRVSAAENEQMKKELSAAASLQQQLNSEKGQNSELMDNLNRIKAELGEKDATINEAKNELNAKNAQLATAQNELNAKAAELASAQGEMGGNRAQAEAFKSELREKSAQAETLQNEVASLKGELSAKLSSEKEAQAKLKQLEQDLGAATSKAKAVQSDLQTEGKKCQQTQDDLQKKLRSQAAEGGQLSVMAAVAKTGSIASDMVQHLLDQTDVDELVADAVSVQVGVVKDFTATATAFTVNAAAQVSSVDYSQRVEDITSHELYVKHVAPHVATITTASQPYVKQYVQPAMDSAREMINPYLNPAMETAKRTYDTAAKAVQTDVLPVLKKGTSQAYGHVSSVMNDAPKHAEKARAGVADFLEPLFQVAHKAAPRHKDALPKHTVDRILFLVALLVAAYYMIRVGGRTFWITLKIVLRVAFKFIRIAYRLIMIPLKVIKKVLGLTICISTGFYCCGLCRRRKKATPTTNGASKKKGTDAKAVPEASAKEVQALLDKAKAKGKLADGVKTLMAAAKNGKTPTGLEGKQITKETIKAVAAKYKELDLKKLGL